MGKGWTANFVYHASDKSTGKRQNEILRLQLHPVHCSSVLGRRAQFPFWMRDGTMCLSKRSPERERIQSFTKGFLFGKYYWELERTQFVASVGHIWGQVSWSKFKLLWLEYWKNYWIGLDSIDCLRYCGKNEVKQWWMKTIVKLRHLSIFEGVSNLCFLIKALLSKN